MPLISSRELEERTQSPDNLVNKLKDNGSHLSIVPTRNNLGRPIGSVETPIEIKKVVGVLSQEGVPQKNLAQVFDIDRSQVSNYRNGKTSYQKNEELTEVMQDTKARLSENKEKAEDLAITSLLTALELVPEKIDKSLPLKTLLSTGRQLSTIANTISGRGQNSSQNGGDNQVHVHIYAPKQKELKDYEVIDV